ncbi:guanine nucleotide binding protein, alpha subunit [Lentinula raphanica]|uniref:Guanine nucleotide binding protein, alpha subunit n=1 Tax=Lentinula raphanica TaxID=153919 RepID=A0AA38UJJ7_9AGAR|nr:guanine nucleotide binding protein, alpha subunit [Lentinula raphanica]KAJ3821023.1 guanine nucleotide binding protein, alpha subunit [Lentinula raphanica]KAJ3840812.1 guanine nucleotide binding protein, alpha subunit [Lentinula raphanica]KAJ3966846.1 guanine nucleotide binding protein, alpha subunit [Lentinula raphanica]
MPKGKSRSEDLGRRRSLPDFDPLAAALLPPPNETPEEKEIRIKAEIEAKKISDGIDEMLRQERIERKKTRAEVNVLLLGQSESGKSTTLKQFQLLHTPSAFHAERIAWRAVIYLNLVRSVRRILDVLSPEADIDEHEDDSYENLSNGRSPSASSGTRIPNYDVYKKRLGPLIELEDKLTRLLTAPGDSDEPTHLPFSYQPHIINGHTVKSNVRPTPTITIPPSSQISHSQSLPVSPTAHPSPTISNGSSSSWKGREVTVHTSTNWRKALALGGRSKSPKSPHSGEIEGWWEDPDDPVHALNALAPAIQELWNDQNVRQRLAEKGIRLEESAGFYLNEIPRITAKKYIPTNDDVLKARLKTMGVVEHSFLIPSGANRGSQWKIYDVGGARNQRHAWAPYFSDVNAIIFLAPISAFDQVLTEDPHVNRLEDSILLWKGVVSNKLLEKVNFVLFLNKCDLLQAKLNAGVRLRDHMISYGDRPNNYESVSKYLHSKFGNIHQTVTPNKERELYIHFTAVTDTRRTGTIIASVRDIIIKNNLKTLKLV